MAYIDCKLKSQILGTTVGVKLYFPTDLPADVGYTVKGVLTLLHGYTNSGDDWMQMATARCFWAFPGRTCTRAAPAFPVRWTFR